MEDLRDKLNRPVTPNTFYRLNNDIVFVAVLGSHNDKNSRLEMASVRVHYGEVNTNIAKHLEPISVDEVSKYRDDLVTDAGWFTSQVRRANTFQD